MTLQKRTIWIGYDPPQLDAFLVARSSIEKYLKWQIPVRALILSDLQEQGAYTRPMRNGVATAHGFQLHDVISDAPMSTEFSISRFLTPILAGEGLALYMDCDMLVRGDIHVLFDQIDLRKAVSCVKHEHIAKASSKMDNRLQVNYPRKNWSSLMVFNCDHPANDRLTLEMVNSIPGRDLHAFCWLKDEEIGSLDPAWNYLVNVTKDVDNPHIAHFTEGTPTNRGPLRGELAEDLADEWKETLLEWVRNER